ncbi:hypothetical protein H9P43_007649 [Blastocladiella emersonii ATCC 22665]|nr:hypothetical protein H9P43_007649 [Blastocladiella emersonii ATCC 22665]
MSSTNAQFLQVLSKTLPPEMSFNLPKESVYAERQTVQFTAQGGPKFAPGNSISVLLPPRDDMMDTHCTFLQFSAKTTDANVAFCNGIFSVIDRVHIYSASGALLEELPYYNLCQRIEADVTVPQYLKDLCLGVAQGYFASGADKFAVLSGLHRYMLPIKSALLANQKHLPMKYTGGIRVEFTLAPGSDACVVKNNAIPGYTVKDVCIVSDLIKLNDQQIAVMDAAFKKQGLKLFGTTYNHHFLNYSVPNSTLNISDRSASQKDILLSFRDNAVLNDNAKDSFLCAKTITLYQFSVAGRLFPQRPIRCDDYASEAFVELTNAFHGHVIGAGLTVDKFNAPAEGTFVVGRDLESSRTVVSGDKSCKSQAVDMQVILTLSVAPNQRVDAFIGIDVVYEFLPTGEINIYNNVLGQVGSFVNKHMPTVLKGVKTVSKFFERSHNPAVSSIAQMYKTLTICNRDLKNGILYLPRPLSVRGVKVNSAYLCNSWHTVNSKANKVYLTQSRGALTFPGTITVPDGNYTVETFTATLKSLLNNAPSSYLWQGTWDVQVDSTTQKMRLVNDTVDFTIGTGTASLNIHMGFVGAYGYSKVQYGSALVNISPINLLHVYSRNLGTSSRTTCTARIHKTTAYFLV